MPSAANPSYWDRVPYAETTRAMRAGCQTANFKATNSSKFCAVNRCSAPCLSTIERQRLRIAQGIDLQRKNQSVNAWKQNGHPAQTARKGKAGARPG